MKRIAPALLAVLAVAAIATAGILQWQGHRAASQAKRAFAMSELNGEIGLVNVWATWCAPCRREIPTLLEIADQYEAKGVHFVAVNADEGDRKTVDAFVKAQPATLGRHLAFPEDGFLREMGVQALPTTFIVNRRGDVVRSFLGEIDPDQVRATLDQVIASGR